MLAVWDGAVIAVITEMAESNRKARIEEIEAVPRLLIVTLAVSLVA